MCHLTQLCLVFSIHVPHGLCLHRYVVSVTGRTGCSYVMAVTEGMSWMNYSHAQLTLLAVFTVPQVFQSSNLIGQHVIRSQ